MEVLISTDNLVKVLGLEDKAAGGGFENAATVTVTLKNLDLTNVTGQAWPAVLTYVAASNGNYEGFIDDAVVIVKGTDYIAEIVADAGAGKKRTWRIKGPANYSGQ